MSQTTSAIPPIALSWREPNRNVALRWGTYESRYGVTLGAVLLAVAVLQSVNYQSNYFLALDQALAGAAALLGAAVAAAPSPGARRLAAGGVLAGGLLAWYAVLFSGQLWQLALGALCVSVTSAWILLRSRPRVSYVALLCLLMVFGFPRFWAMIVDSGQNTAQAVQVANIIVDVATALLLVAVAWIARRLAITAVQAQEYRAIAQVVGAEAAQAHDQPSPPPNIAPAGPPVARTNTMATLALVFGLLGGWLGIVFGHIALSQIRRTGELGRGSALTGLIAAYIWVGLYVAILVFGLITWISG